MIFSPKFSPLFSHQLILTSTLSSYVSSHNQMGLGKVKKKSTLKFSIELQHDRTPDLISVECGLSAISSIARPRLVHIYKFGYGKCNLLKVTMDGSPDEALSLCSCVGFVMLRLSR